VSGYEYMCFTDINCAFRFYNFFYWSFVMQLLTLQNFSFSFCFQYPIIVSVFPSFSWFRYPWLSKFLLLLFDCILVCLMCWVCVLYLALTKLTVVLATFLSFCQSQILRTCFSALSITHKKFPLLFMKGNIKIDNKWEWRTIIQNE
jgi:hypothetical protein